MVSERLKKVCHFSAASLHACFPLNCYENSHDNIFHEANISFLYLLEQSGIHRTAVVFTARELLAQGLKAEWTFV